ncbi:MAG: hypothetical protein HC886_09600 [Leptolyngbyaceae cyanobacterium SM1_1_3]|nr:hypothetical protein [Leptolyngbyaceae cyanobacterium SM1_1_3]NJN01029.1 hypothetical protein [Leptolyngbyaceae cyanobacterium RM1_1_2]NJO10217.1 hypothetical protein [Leptolyngbyaceae cyanobacterium SL_1_1]
MMTKAAIALLLACTAAAVDEAQTFANLPTGTYRYTTPDSGRLFRTMLLRKSGSAVIGVELVGDRASTDVMALSCFRGQAQGDRLIYVTRVQPPYDPASEWQSGQELELAAGVSRDTSLAPAEQTALETCIQLFWR